MNINKAHILLFAWVGFSIASCKKSIQIPPPIGTISSSQVFSTDNQAVSAATGMFYNMINNNGSFSSYAMSIYGGMSADELIPFDQNFDDSYVQFQVNKLATNNGLLANSFWNTVYSTIYSANAVIEGLNSYSGVHDSVKNELIGEAKFIRAFCDFYLINLFGDVPLITTINWRKTNLEPRAKVSAIYQSIISDLTDAQARMAIDYSVGSGQRIVPNKWAATAMLSRVYAFMGDWVNAEQNAGTVINNTSLFKLDADLNQVFLANSTEAIWQLQQDNTTNSFNATPEGALLVPPVLNSGFQPFAYLTPNLLNTFEVGDLRSIAWIDSTSYNGIEYYFPYKYKMGSGQAAANGPYTEYYMVLRLAEQYLIRAEAEANGAGGGLNAAVKDLNIIRSRAGLSGYSGSIDKISLLNAIQHERQVELFCEWGNRWLDLIRSKQAHGVLGAIPYKQPWSDSSLIYPIPYSEINVDPNLVQNPGY